MTISELRRIVRGVDPAAFVVPSRVVRRAIKHDRGLPKLALKVPHRRAFAIHSDAALKVIDREELGLEPGEWPPSTLILLAEPEPDELSGLPPDEVLRSLWRRLFHARIDVEMTRKLEDGSIGPAGLRDRIRRLDRSAFEEARSVLRQEERLLPPRSDPHIYAEFAATYLELRAFAPGLVADYFPAIRDTDAADLVFAEDVDAEALLAATRLPGTAEPSDRPAEATDELEPGEETDLGPEPPSGAGYRRFLKRADRSAERGNLVRAAILRTRAARLAGPSLAGQARSAARDAMGGLAGRLKAALGFDEDDLRQWRKALVAPLDRSSRGFWLPDARLLYDLQKVCVDYERPVYAVDLVGWAASMGRRPLRRLLPHHQEVLMVQHLRGSRRHLTAARLPEADRARFERLLDRAVHRAEEHLRDRLRPEIGRALEETGFAARDLPERVALQKLNEELLDRVVETGFLAMGELRDALSRNNRKLPDLAGPVEFLVGDRLLQADRRLGKALDGVYRRGEIYLRALQRLSALAFGTRPGRLLTRYLILPYGGTAVVLKGLQEVVGPLSHWLLGEEMHLLNPVSLAINGTLAIGLLYSKGFRQTILRYLGHALRVGQGLLVGLPSWLFRREWVRRIVRSPAFALTWRAAILPATVAGIAWVLHPASATPGQIEIACGLIFLTTSLMLTTRAGRDLEELAFDSMVRTWTWFISNLLPGLFRLVMETFDRLLEAVERVLYTVDEWLRFRAGQGPIAMAAKGVLGVAWFLITYVVRFCVTLLVEPQVNPIKHFPVVTVSHKIMLTQAFAIEAAATGLFGRERGLALAGTFMLLMPGVFGFLVWELKENWRLYEANRPRSLRPVVIGHHGETMARLLKPGFHSGTIPKLFAKLRKAERKAIRTGHAKGVRTHLAHLQGVEESVRHFLDRDFLTLLLQSRSMAGMPMALGRVVPSSKRLLVELVWPGRGGPSLWLSFEEHSGWLLAGLTDPGWLADLATPERNALATALAGLYKMAGVDLVREPILDALGPEPPDFDLREEGLVVWPDAVSATEILYLLRPRPGVEPFVTLDASGEPSTDTPPRLDTARLLFADASVPWKRWVEVWERDRAGEDPPPEFVPGLRLLPPTDAQDSGLRPTSLRTEG
ncbi:hypothetical protein P12x_002496 [Tundrisphaera lichenicola]|uniref:hypothetical protein n=1 Tax=Tundrisphaera lichenicola TaxID=2029860 RepID=UPI003EC058BA